MSLVKCVMIVDIVCMVGVFFGVVFFVLNGCFGVSEEIRQCIFLIVEENGWQLSFVVCVLVGVCVNMVGFVFVCFV